MRPVRKPTPGLRYQVASIDPETQQPRADWRDTTLTELRSILSPAEMRFLLPSGKPLVTITRAFRAVAVRRRRNPYTGEEVARA